MTSRGAAALESLSNVPPVMAGPRHPESPSSLSLLGNGLNSGLPSIGPLRSGSASGLPSFGGSLNLEELLGELAQAQSAAMVASQQHQYLHQQHIQQHGQQQHRQSEAQRPELRPQRLSLPPMSFSFPASQPRIASDGAKSSEEIWRSIHGGLSMHGGALGSGAWAAPPDDVLTGKHGEGGTPRLGSSLASMPSAATHFAPAGGSVATLSGVSMSGSVSALGGGHGVRPICGNGSMSSAGLSGSVGGMRLQSGSTEMASHMAAAALAAGADPSWFPYVGGGSMGGLPSLDHALQTVAACRSQQWAQTVAAGRASASGSPSHSAPATQSYARGQLSPGRQHQQQQHQLGSQSLEMPPYASLAAADPGSDMHGSSMESAMELTRSLQQKFMADSGRSAATSPRGAYLPQQYSDPAAAMAASLGVYNAGVSAAPARTSPSASPPRFDAGIVTQVPDATIPAAQRRGGRVPHSPSTLPSVASETLSMRSMPAIPAAARAPPPSNGGSGSVGSLSGNASAPAGGLSARQRHKLTKGRTVDMDEREMRDMKRKEANRESAARSRDKRLKLIADLELEVEELKRKHEAFKERVIKTTVPRELVEGPVMARRTPLRRANTDPLDAASHIADALTRAPVNLTKLGAAGPALIKTETACVSESTNGLKIPCAAAAAIGANGRCNGGIPSVNSAEVRGSAPEPASRAEAAALRAG